ncbi:hypothetical protein A11Q_2172 [Pseudobdellovibrio exovorus JSS]|uniref:Uncharacterized protein n=1 Tax=Pseudobdellovibrio exovorus JSS TaxID=1184267 RepID=M4VAZ2_9BACT|nr:hypothetical protein A11Q_2172 [Pseudobdellovibrio exovorus JSS]
MKSIISSRGFVSKKRNYFDKLNLIIWFAQLLLSLAVAMS